MVQQVLLISRLLGSDDDSVEVGPLDTAGVRPVAAVSSSRPLPVAKVFVEATRFSHRLDPRSEDASEPIPLRQTDVSHIL